MKWAKYKQQMNEKKNKTEAANPANSDNFAFPNGGWVCSECQNYNFCGRSSCNRCDKQKDDKDFNGKPKHLLKNETTQAKRVEPEIETPAKKDTQAPVATAAAKKGRKDGDWVCPFCSNLNFSFRNECNRCK